MNPTPISRRRFITVAGAGAVWITAGCRDSAPLAHPMPTSSTTPPTSPPTSPTLPPTNTTVPKAMPVPTSAPTVPGDRVLVLVQLLGGNDGLGTLVPIDGRYHDTRPTIGIADGDLAIWSGLTGHGLHPALAPLTSLWDAGELAIAAGVGFDEQTRSHFDSRDVWWRAGVGTGTDGWLARWLAAATVDDPDDPLEALALGAGPRALAGSTASAVGDPTDSGLQVPAGMTAGDFESYLLATSRVDDGEPDAVRAARASAVAAISTQKILAEVVEPTSDDPYTAAPVPELELQLRAAASLIVARPTLRVVTVGVEGFDTHAGQVGAQAELLGRLATAMSGFWSALGEAGRARTMVLTASEFGRRVAENGSGGTDHGRGGVQFVLGGGVRGGQLIGGHDLGALVDGDLPIVVPGLDVFAEGLRWLGGPVGEVLGTEPPPTGLLRA